ncbi:MAG: hypothetical protein Kow002_19110 [Anaerolineales bacterium]
MPATTDLLMFSSFTGLLWFVLMLLPLVFFQRQLHKEIQASLYLASGRNAAFTMGVFSFIFFPGVVLHEFSHFVVARLLGVRTHGFSVIPKMMPEGYLRMGYVSVDQSDIVRDSLIGLAPLVFGNLAVAYIAVNHLELQLLWSLFQEGNFGLFWMGVSALPSVEDFFVWFYLTFVISGTMLPSRSDRHAWLPLGLTVIALFVLALFAGAGPWMLEHLAPPLNTFLQSVAVLFGLSAFVHGVLIPPMLLIHKLFARWVDWDVE